MPLGARDKRKMVVYRLGSESLGDRLLTSNMAGTRDNTTNTPNSVTKTPLLRVCTKMLQAFLIAVIPMALLFAGPAHAARTGGRAGGSSFGGFSSSRGFGGSSMLGGGTGGMAGFGSRGSHHSGGWGLSQPHHRTVGSYGTTLVSPGLHFHVMPTFGLPMPIGGGAGSLGSAVVTAGVLVLAMLAFSAWMQSRQAGPVGRGEPFTVVLLQVGLLANAKDFRVALRQAMRYANTSTSQGYHQLLQDVCIELQRAPQFWQYGYTQSSTARDEAAAEKLYNSMSQQQRAVYHTETFSNYSGRQRSMAAPLGTAKQPDELLVVTLMVAVHDRLQLRQVTSAEALKHNLLQLGGIAADDLAAFEVVWTPEEESDYYTHEDLATDYPALANI